MFAGKRISLENVAREITMMYSILEFDRALTAPGIRGARDGHGVVSCQPQKSCDIRVCDILCMSVTSKHQK